MQTMNPAVEKFLEHWAEVVDLERASSVLSWDQETKMPHRGGAARGKIQATLAGLRHAKLSSSEYETGNSPSSQVDGVGGSFHS